MYNFCSNIRSNVVVEHRIGGIWSFPSATKKIKAIKNLYQVQEQNFGNNK